MFCVGVWNNPVSNVVLVVDQCDESSFPQSILLFLSPNLNMTKSLTESNTRKDLPDLMFVYLNWMVPVTLVRLNFLSSLTVHPTQNYSTCDDAAMIVRTTW